MPPLPPLVRICVYLCKHTCERVEKTRLFPNMCLEKGSALFTPWNYLVSARRKNRVIRSDRLVLIGLGGGPNQLLFSQWRILDNSMWKTTSASASYLVDWAKIVKLPSRGTKTIVASWHCRPGKFLRVRKVFARYTWNCTGKLSPGLESFRIVWKVSGWSRKLPDNLEGFPITWKVSG